MVLRNRGYGFPSQRFDCEVRGGKNAAIRLCRRLSYCAFDVGKFPNVGSR